jgi:hypothetical protein
LYPLRKETFLPELIDFSCVFILNMELIYNQVNN